MYVCMYIQTRAESRWRHWLKITCSSPTSGSESQQGVLNSVVRHLVFWRQRFYQGARLHGAVTWWKIHALCIWKCFSQIVLFMNCGNMSHAIHALSIFVYVIKPNVSQWTVLLISLLCNTLVHTFGRWVKCPVGGQGGTFSNQWHICVNGGIKPVLCSM